MSHLKKIWAVCKLNHFHLWNLKSSLRDGQGLSAELFCIWSGDAQYSAK